MKFFILLIIIVFSNLSVAAQKKMNTTSMQKKMTAKTILFPKKDTTITIKLTRRKFDYLLQTHIDFAGTASELMENYIIPVSTISPASSDTGKQEIISQRINEDGRFETKFADGSKKIYEESGGYTIISPDGRGLFVRYVQVPTFVPPMLPDDVDVIKYLQNTSDGLLSLVSDLLNNDTISIANFKKGDANLNIYEIINRRFKFINYINSEK
jgi:hypothetical protein